MIKRLGSFLLKVAPKKTPAGLNQARLNLAVSYFLHISARKRGTKKGVRELAQTFDIWALRNWEILSNWRNFWRNPSEN